MQRFIEIWGGMPEVSILTILDSEDIAHPDLEVLLTMTEERGMEGAIGKKKKG